VEGDFWQAIKNREFNSHEDWRSFTAPVWFPVIEYGSYNDLGCCSCKLHGPLEEIYRKHLVQAPVDSGIVVSYCSLGMFFDRLRHRRAQKLARLRLDFVANVSHELLTPIAAIHP